MTARSSLLRHVAMTVGALVVGTLVVVAPSVEQRVAKASSVGLDDTFSTFNGSNYFSANDNDIFDVTGNITVSAWIRPTSLCATSECVIVSKETNYLFAIRNGTFQYALMNSGGSVWDWRGTGGVIPVLNQWQHVSFTVGRSTSDLWMYMNGRQVYSVRNATDVPNTGFNSGGAFTIGARHGGANGRFSGSIDEVRVYNTTRASAAQAQADMNTWGPANAAGLVLYYDFNEGSGSTLNNRVTGASTATNLTATGSPTWGAVRTQTQLIATTRIAHTFTRSYLVAAGGWTVPAGVTSANVLVVGGGGGGSDLSDFSQWAGGGGGAGGYRNVTGTSLTPGAVVTVSVGGGGHRASKSVASFVRRAENGADSVFGSIQSFGGGAGGGGSHSGWQNGAIGGSGGGGGTYGGLGAAGSSGQGNAGGNAWANCCGAGGGGGAGSAGGTSTSGTGGAAGNGVSNSISGTAVFYAGGGAGHGDVAAGSAGTSGGTPVGTNGAEGVGSGGGGGKGPGGATAETAAGHGGTGVVIVSYATPCDTQQWTGAGGSTLIQYQVPSGFTSCNANFTTPANVTALDAVIVGGGGGGGGGNSPRMAPGGGGGGGQVLNLRAQTVAANTSFSIVVGGGGSGGAGSAVSGTPSAAGSTGVASSAFGSTANGGVGGGGSGSTASQLGFSGYGGNSGSGNAGGAPNWEAGGGGAGAGSPGNNAMDGPGGGATGGYGGNGVMPGWVIGWCSGMFAGGGGGGSGGTDVVYPLPLGGAGGGGNGATGTTAPTGGANHCGAGGGGGGGNGLSHNGANGGSGVVYVRYNHAYSAESFTEGSSIAVALGTATNLGLSNVVTDYTMGETVRVRMNVTNGTLSIVSASGTTVTGNNSSSVTLVGSQANLNTALASATLNATTLTSTQLMIDVDMNPVSQTIDGRTYTPHTNGHFYTFRSITNARVWEALDVAVRMQLGGRQGFLATPTSADEMTVMRTVAGSSSAWLGIADDFQENTFRLLGEDAWGPVSTGVNALSFRYTNWASNEPNNSGGPEAYNSIGSEDYVQINSGSASWNDHRPFATMNGALVEFEPKSSRIMRNVTFTGAASRTATVSSASNLGLGTAHIGASTFNTNETIVATLTAPAGTTLAATGAATISGSGTRTLTLEGTKANVNSTLNNVTATAGTIGDTTITVSYRAKLANNGTSSNYKYNAGTGNFYFAPGAGSHTSAETDAEALRFGGVPGFVVSVTSAAEQSWLRTNMTTGPFWTALKDTDNEGQWTMRTRDAYQTNGFDNVALPGAQLPWNTGEPNGARNQNCHASQWDSNAGDDGTCSSSTTRIIEFRTYAVTQDVTLGVSAAPTLAAPTTGLTATVGQAYSLTLSASGGVSPYTYNVVSGALPSGLTLSLAGVISGTATDAPQSQAITVRATDANGGTGTSSSFTLSTNATTCTTATTVVGGHTVQRFTDAGYCQWQVPAGVTSVDGFVVAGGGGGGTDGGSGGGGGGYHPRNGIAVTPGEILTIRVGDGGSPAIWQGAASTSGQSSFVTRGTTQLLNANGGQAGVSNPNGSPGGAGGTSTGGFAGGTGGTASSNVSPRGTGGAVGVTNYFLGVVNEYSGGGGGGIWDGGSNNWSSMLGASGGGNGCDASSPTSNTTGFPARVNSGGGGGAGCAGMQTNGGRGGSGIAMIRYTTDALDAFPADIEGLQARFVADDYQTLNQTRKTWVDSSNNARHVTTVGGLPAVVDITGNGSTKTVRTLWGGLNENLTWPSSVISSNNYTLFHLARYSGAAKARIFTSNSGNWLSGFWDGGSGVAHHNVWMTSFSPSNASTSSWVLSSDQNTLYRANGRSFTTNTSGLSQSGALTINIGYSDVERSDWQVPEVIVYNRVLSETEIRRVESYLTRTYGLLGHDSSNVAQGILSPRTVAAARTGNASTGSSSQLSVSWTAPTETTGITDYKVEYKAQSDTTWSEWAHTASASLTGATLTGLTGGTTYDIRVSAVEPGVTNRPSVATTATTWGASSIQLTSVPASPKTSTTYTLVATVSDATGTSGTVAFMENGVAISGCATKAVVSGLATCSWNPATLGARSLTASFTGDTNNLSATTVSASSLTVESGICTTTVGTTGRFTFWQILDTASCELPALPAGVESIDTFVLGGGGGGGTNVGSGGGGGGAYYATNVAADSTDVITVTVGAGGRAGGSSLNAATVDALRDGGAGGTSSISWDSTTFSGAGGFGGQTYWSDNTCNSSGSRVTARPAGGSGTGTGGTSSTGGSGGLGSAVGGGATEAGGAGFSNSITGSPVSYGGAGGGGGWNTTGGAGGTGGGASGGTNTGIGSSGTANTGGGGGGGSGSCSYGGQGGSGRVIVRFANTPTITTQPAAASKTRGQSHTFSVTPSATGAIAADFTYQWKKDGVAISGAISSTYTIASLSTTDAGDYSVTVKSSSGGFAVSSVESAEVELTVDKATQTITFAALTARTYGDAAFSITATASSGLLVGFASSNTSVCSVAVGTVSGGVTTASVTVGVVGSCVITASQAGGTEFFAATSVTQTLTVTQKTLTLTGLVAANKEYNRTDIAIVDFSGHSFGSSVVGSDVVSLVSTGYGATFSDRNVANGKTVTVTGLSLSGAAADNYQLPSPITTTANITSKQLTASGITALPKEYDRLLTATLHVGSASLNGVISGDTVNIVTGSATGAFADKTVANGKTVTVSGLSLSGGDSGNYTLAAYTTTANITAKQLTATNITAANKEYDRGLTATLSLGSAGLSGVVSGDTVNIVTGSATGAFADKTVANGKTVTVSGLSLSGGDSGNYTLAAYTTTADITAKQLTVSGITASNKDYDKLRTAVVQGGSATLGGVISGDIVTVGTSSITGLFDTALVGTNKTVQIAGVTISGADAANYTVAQPTAVASISTKTITVSGVTASNKEYDALRAATVSFGSATISGIETGDAVQLDITGVTAQFANKSIGVNKDITITGLALTGANAANYQVVQPSAQATITAKQLTATNITAANKEYDRGLTAVLSLGSAGLNGVIAGDNVSIVTSSATGAFGSKNVADGKTVTVSGLSLSGTDSGNYTLAGFTTTANITAKQLTATNITAANKEYDRGLTAVLSLGSAALDGVISGDAVSIVTSSATGAFATKIVENGKTVTVSGLSLSGGDAANYTLAGFTTTANITAKQLTATNITAANKEYDRLLTATLSLGSAGLSGVISGDAVSIVTSSATGAFADKTVSNGKTVTVSGLSITGADAANYTLAGFTTTANITAKQLTATNISAENKEYNQQLNATLNLGSAALDGVISGDAVSIVTSSATGAFGSKTVANGKTVTVSGLSLSGGDAANYTLASYTTTANITAKQLTATNITAANKEYDRGLTAVLSLGSAALNGVISGDTVNIVTSSATGAFATKIVENGKTVTVSGLSLSGGDAGNYTLAGFTTTANITAKQLTATNITAANKEYDRGLAAVLSLGSAALDGVISGDAVSIVTSSATGAFADKTVSNGKTVTVSGLTLSGGDAANYTLAGFTTTANITAKQLTATNITAANKEYDRGLTAVLSLGSAALNGVISGDAVSIVTSSATGAFADKTVSNGKTVTVSGLTLSGGDAANYTLAGFTTTANITAMQLTATNITAASKEYDRGLTAVLSLGSAGLNGVISGDIVSIVTSSATGAFTTKIVENGKTVTVSGLSITGGDAANYTLAGFTTTANITAKQLTATNITAANKEYDRGLTAVLSLGSAALNGVISGDNVSIVTSSATGAFADKTVSNGKTVTVSGLSLSGGDAANYTLAGFTTTANITAKQVTVSGITASDKDYNKNRTAVVQHGAAELAGVISGDQVTINTSSITGQFDTALVGNNKTVQIAGVALAGTDAGNYEVVQPTTRASISTKTITVSGVTASNKEYDADIDATVSFLSASISGLETGDVVQLNVAGVTAEFATKVIGSNKTVSVSGLALSGADADNYRIVQPTAQAAITAKQLTARNITASNKEYDQELNAVLSLGSAGLNGVIAGDTVNIVTSSATGAFATKIVENGKTVTVSGLSLSGGDAGNYTLAGYTTTANITAKQLTATNITAANKEYDRGLTAVLSLGSAALNGVIAGDTVNIVTSSATGAFATKIVENGKTVTVSGLSLSGGDAGNYTLAGYTTTANITAKQLTASNITAANKEYDRGLTAVLSLGSAGLNGVISGDAVNIETGSASGAFTTKTASNGKTVTVSGLSIDGADAANYTLAPFTTTANITAKQLTATNITAANKEYDRGLTAVLSLGSAALNGVISGDAVSIVTSSATGAFATKIVENGKTVTVSGLSLSGGDAANYTLAGYTTTANITAKHLTATNITAANKEYDRGLTAVLSLGSAALDGVIAGDTVNIVTSAATGAFATKIVENGKTVTVSGLTITGSDAGNYTLAGYTTTANITAKQLTATNITAANKEYDQGLTVVLSLGSAALNGVIAGDTVNIETGSASGAFATKTVANGKTVTVSSLSISGVDAANYTLAPFTTTANITAKQLTATNITAVNKEYDRGLTAALSLGSAGLNGVIAGDTVNIVTSAATGAFATKIVENGKTVTVSGLTISGLDAGNYTLAGYTTTANITAKQLTATNITAVNKEYDRGLTAALSLGSAGLNGVIAGDAVNIVTSSATGAFATKIVENGKIVTVSGLTIAGADSGNYTLAGYTTTANITAKQLTAGSITAANKEYDRGLTAVLSLGSAVLNGVIAGDTVNIVTTSATGAFGSKTVENGKTVTVSGLTIAGADADNYTLAGYTTTANITAKQLTATNITAANKEYDRGLTAVLSLGSAGLNGVIAGDTVNIVTTSATGAFATKIVENGKTVTVSGLTITGSDSGNYTLAGYTTTANITAKQLLATNITAANKEYDQGVTVILSLGSAGLNGVIAGDTVNIETGSASGAFTTKTVSNGKTVTVSGLSIDGADATNYTLAPFTTTANITAKQLLATNITAANKEYDRGLTAVLALGSAGLSGVISGDTVSIVTSSATGAFTTKIVENGKTVTVSGLTIAGADAGNYALAGYTTTANITAKQLTATSITAANKEYDRGLTAVLSLGSAGLNGVITGDAVNIVTSSATGAFATKIVENGKIVTVSGLTLSGGDAGNYTLAGYTTTANITAKQLLATNITASNKEYDSLLTASLNVASAGLLGVISGDTVNIETGSATGAFATKTAAMNKIVTVSSLSISGADSGNYTLAGYTTTANITAKQLTATNITAANKEYDQLLTAVLTLNTAGLNGVVAGDTVNIVTTSAVGAFTTKTVANNKTVTVSGLSISGTDAVNYTLAGYTTTANITAKQLLATNITASNKEYNQLLSATLNVASAGLSGVIDGDTVTIVTTSASGAFANKTVENGKTVTVSGLTLSGIDALNYTLAGYTTTANITAKQLTATNITARDKEYDQLLSASLRLNTAGLSGVISGDTVNIETGSAVGVFGSKTVAEGKTVTINGLSISGADAGNYILPSVMTTTASIVGKQLTATNITAASKEYDQLLTASLTVNGAGLNGVIDGDTVTIVTASAAGAFATKTVGVNKAVTVSGLSITGADSVNYVLAPTTVTASITARSLTVSGITAADKIFDGTTTASISVASASLNGILDNDIVVIDTTNASGNFVDEKVGSNKTVRISRVAVTGTDGANYVVTQPTTTATIITAVTAWMDYRAEAVTTSAEQTVSLLSAPQVLPPAPARVSTQSVSGGRSTRVTAVRSVRDAAIPVTHAIITVLNSRNRVLARINVKVDPANPTTAVTVPYARRNVRVTVQFANDIGISQGGPSGVNVTQGNTFDWASVDGRPQVRGTEVPGSLIFARGSSTLTNSMKASLRQMARTVTSRGGLVYVTGYAQNGEIASAWRLESLAQKRAEVVARYLTSIGVRQWVTFQGHAGVRSPWNTARERRVAISTEAFYG